jgi:hypothetical protein
MKKHDDEAEDIGLIKRMTVKTDPSVKVTDLELKGEPLGCVPLERTMRKPDTYYPAKPGPK